MFFTKNAAPNSNTDAPTIVLTDRMPSASKTGCRTELLLPVPPLLMVVITGMTNPIPKASINVPNRTINISTGIVKRDLRGRRLQSMPTVPSFLAGAFIWLQNYPNLRNG